MFSNVFIVMDVSLGKEYIFQEENRHFVCQLRFMHSPETQIIFHAHACSHQLSGGYPWKIRNTFEYVTHYPHGISITVIQIVLSYPLKEWFYSSGNGLKFAYYIDWK